MFVGRILSHGRITAYVYFVEVLFILNSTIFLVVAKTMVVGAHQGSIVAKETRNQVQAADPAGSKTKERSDCV